MRRLIWAFAGLTYHIVGNLMSWLICLISQEPHTLHIQSIDCKNLRGNKVDKCTAQTTHHLQDFFSIVNINPCHAGYNYILHSSQNCILFYFILSSEINAYLKQIKMEFSQSKTIWLISAYIALMIDSTFLDYLWLFYSLNVVQFKSSNAYNFLIFEQNIICG